MKNEKIEIENINVPGKVSRVDAQKYEYVKNALISVLSPENTQMTAKDMVENIKPLLPNELWPNGEKVGWWQKTVQLDLEAKGIISRVEDSKPVRWYLRTSAAE